MRRIYVVPKSIHDQQRQLFATSLTTHWLGLCESSDKAVMAAWITKGCPIAISTEFASEGPQEKWETHPLVTVLPHPVWQGRDPIHTARTMPENLENAKWGSDPLSGMPQFKHTALHTGFVAPSGWGSSLEGEETVETDGVDHITSVFGVMTADTILDVHRKLAAVHPAFRLRALR